MQVHNGKDIFSLKWRTTTEHFVQDHTDRVDIGAGKTTLTFQLFWGHIVRRSHRTRKTTPGHTARTLQQSNTKINNFDIAIILDHDILRFNVAMKYPMLMAILQGITKLQRNTNSFRRR